MNRFSSFIDVAGRVSRTTDVFHRVTAAAVTLPTADLDRVRSRLSGTSKWSESGLSQASNMVDLMTKHAVAVGIVTVNKRTPAWDKFWVDSVAIERTIKKQDGKPAGFVRAPNVLRFYLMGTAAVIGFSRAQFRTRTQSHIVDFMERSVLEHDMVFDNDIQGAENEETLRTIMGMPTPKSEKQFNFTVERRMSLTTDQDEPLLLLADFAAGIAHAANLPEADQQLPLRQDQAKQLLGRLHDADLLAIQSTDFNIKADDVFQDLATPAADKPL